MVYFDDHHLQCRSYHRIGLASLGSGLIGKGGLIEQVTGYIRLGWGLVD